VQEFFCAAKQKLSLDKIQKKEKKEKKKERNIGNVKRTKWNEPTSQEKQMERERKKQIGFRLEKKEKTINTESGSIAPKKDMHPKKKTKKQLHFCPRKDQTSKSV
jgi:hypothetical protein